VNRPALDAFAADAGEPALAGPFDLAFIDALKHEYPAYVEAIVPRLASGALLIADNVLWAGRVSGERPSSPGDATDVLRAFDSAMLRDPRFTATILPIGDGLLLAGFRG
jgi:predicted O-methyltransferase YrrM